VGKKFLALWRSKSLQAREEKKHQKGNGIDGKCPGLAVTSRVYKLEERLEQTHVWMSIQITSFASESFLSLNRFIQRVLPAVMWREIPRITWHYVYVLI
jgi:hypothetical protein